ncbi:hypothetical protein C474_18124 [Halogeometricum pallidum JCM 14848]|uniref:Uncharacterized protein n=1 Tax=Halogeometricum pallidum JCM 14848 TaxID=1227487 RepID=M0CZG2_HALPD|nr:hypothetical protein [Halogeometricum pallidum]ELZ27289.1 hypothetical protein C474_18124 [Halogeometricum pallidum JCM 14848]
MSSQPRTAANPLVGFVAASERRRVLVALGVPLLFLLAVELAANLGVLPLVLAAGLAAYLYARPTARATLAAGAAGTGLLLLSLFLLQVYSTVAGGSTEPLAGTVARLSGWVLLGTALLALGAWLSGAGRRGE